jgi:hypothetical protein
MVPNRRLKTGYGSGVPLALLVKWRYCRAVMYCHTWDHLYDVYESVSLQRVQRAKATKRRAIRFSLNPIELEHLNAAINEALRKLREHEKVHGCR